MPEPAKSRTRSSPDGPDGAYVVLAVGRPELVDHDAPMDPDASEGWFVLRTGKGYALLFVDTTDDLVERLGPDLLRSHKERRGILVADIRDPVDEPIGDTYDALVKELEKLGGRWIAVAPDAKVEMPVPDPPRAKIVDFEVVPPARAMREHALTETPKRVVRRNLKVRGTTADIVSFYIPKLEAAGFEVQHDKWPKRRTEELDGLRKDARLVIGTVATSDTEVFVQLLFITR
jgi:hypothetical protein